MSILLATIAIVAGLVALMWSADRFINGAAATARNFGMSPMLIGLTVVSLGTSAPEILISATAAFSGYPGLSVGNALGSNIANIGLVLALTLLLCPLRINSKILRRELPLLLVVTVLAGACLYDREISRLDAIVLLSAMVLTLTTLVYWQRHGNQKDALAAEEEESIPTLPQRQASWLLFTGLLVLLASSRLLVWGATEIATSFGVSDLVIGLTIVAIGTSLPELAASVTSARKGHDDIALGNVVGSNIFNLLAVLPMPGLIKPSLLPPEVFNRDYLVMLGLTALLTAVILYKRQALRMGRGSGTLLLSAYIVYSAVLYLMHNPASSAL